MENLGKCKFYVQENWELTMLEQGKFISFSDKALG